MNLLFTILWLMVGVGLFAYEWATGQVPFTIRGLNVSAGWLFFLLAGWNFARWYSYRVQKAEQQALRQTRETRLAEHRHRERPRQYDPTFDFREKGPPPEPPSGR
jgi:hypothetical protein